MRYARARDRQHWPAWADRAPRIDVKVARGTIEAAIGRTMRSMGAGRAARYRDSPPARHPGSGGDGSVSGVEHRRAFADAADAERPELGVGLGRFPGRPGQVGPQRGHVAAGRVWQPRGQAVRRRRRICPTAELADIVLPVASAFETEALRVGFEVSEAAQAYVQLRQRVVPPRGERSDIEIAFDLANRLGLGDRFFGGDVEAAWRHQLAPSGITLEALRAQPHGIRLPVVTRHRKYAESRDGVPAGFPTPSRRIELYSEAMLDHGYPPLPEFDEPGVSPRSCRDLAARFPLILTSAKDTHFCETQHRNVPSLRRRAPDPQVELHPDLAAARGIGAGDWVRISTPAGSVRARARLNDSLHKDVVCGQHGWWEPCEEIGAAGYDPYRPDGANLNLLIETGEIQRLIITHDLLGYTPKELS